MDSFSFILSKWCVCVLLAEELKRIGIEFFRIFETLKNLLSPFSSSPNLSSTNSSTNFSKMMLSNYSFLWIRIPNNLILHLICQSRNYIKYLKFNLDLLDSKFIFWRWIHILWLNEEYKYDWTIRRWNLINFFFWTISWTRINITENLFLDNLIYFWMLMNMEKSIWKYISFSNYCLIFFFMTLFLTSNSCK